MMHARRTGENLAATPSLGWGRAGAANIKMSFLDYALNITYKMTVRKHMCIGTKPELLFIFLNITFQSWAWQYWRAGIN